MNMGNQFQIPGLLEVWATGRALHELSQLDSVIERRQAELDVYPGLFTDDIRNRMYEDRARRYAIKDVSNGDIYPWSRHLLTMHIKCEEIPIGSPESVAAGIPAIMEVDVENPPEALELPPVVEDMNPV